MALIPNPADPHLLPHAQTMMDLHVLPMNDLWAVFRDCMSADEWAKACGTNRATYALRRPLVAAQLHACKTLGTNERDLIRQLQIDRWPSCHSLFLNLQRVPEGFQANAAVLDQIHLADSKLHLLHCMHIICGEGVLLTESSMEGLLVSVLARHASVLTLQVKALKMPLTMPNLQHLMLDLGREMSKYFFASTQEMVFPAIGLLESLRTLYIQTYHFVDVEPPNLTNCVCLQHVTLRRVHFVRLDSSQELALPAGCQLHAILGTDLLRNFYYEITGVIVRNNSIWCMEIWVNNFMKYITFNIRNEPASNLPSLFMSNLKRLRLILSENSYQLPDKDELECRFDHDNIPTLEVLELDVQWNLFLSIEVPLKSLVVIVAGKLRLDIPSLCSSIAPTPIYIQSGNDFWPKHKEMQQASFAKQRCSVPAERLPEYIRDEQGYWFARRPASFHPSSLQDCCCGACPECLARAGVHVMCHQAWTSNGFQKHLRPHCRAEP